MANWLNAIVDSKGNTVHTSSYADPTDGKPTTRVSGKVELTGSNVKDVFSGSASVKKNYTNKMDHFSIVNTGNSSLTFTINGLTIPVAAGEVYDDSFDEFSTVDINATSSFKAQVKGKYGPVVTPAPDTISPVVTIAPNGGTFNSSQSVTLSVNETADIYYTLDGSTPTTSSQKYMGPITLSATTTIKFFAKDTAGNTSAVQSVTFTKDASAPADTTPPIVNISPAPGTYTSTQSVTLSVNETADIYYTTDGSTPTTSSPKYTSPISVAASMTIKYFAKDTAGNSSAVQTATYTVNSGGPTILAQDSFNRANAATLGTAEVGGTWAVNTSANGTYELGIVNNAATFVGGTYTSGVNKWRRFNTLTIPTNAFVLEVTAKSPAGTSAQMAIGLRCNGSLDNILYLERAGTMGGASSQYLLRKYPAGGSVTTIATGTIKASETDQIKIEHLADGTIKVYINGVLDITATDTFGLSATTKVGLGAELNTNTFDDFKVTSL